MASLKQQIKQASVIIRTSWIRNMNYRFTTFTYRVGEISETLIIILMWTAIYASSNGAIKGFTLNEMITYVLIGTLCSVAVRSFLPSLISLEIREGRMSTYLVKPISYIKYILISEIGRAGFAIFASVTSQLLVIVFFLNRLVINTDWRYILLIVAMLFFAVIIEVLIGLLIGFVAFWTDEVDGLYNTIGQIKRFFSGGYFPLSILPVGIALVGTWLPFAYSFFMPAQLYLRKATLHEGLVGIGIQIIWIIILSIIVNFVWKAGLRRYEASGS